ncbi:hypothetical protein EAF04_009059 [Stromatinia cepivora]|nr:hypothetical protein EAF04_009059 [Stromatinia cepivora]
MATTRLSSGTTGDGDNKNRNDAGKDDGCESANDTSVVETGCSNSRDIDQPEATQGEEFRAPKEEDDLYAAMAFTSAINTQNTAQQNPPAKTFHRFCDFPAEVRCIVWKYHMEDEEDFRKPRTLTIIAKYTGKNPANNHRCTYVSQLCHRMALTTTAGTHAFDKKATFPWTAQPARPCKIPASFYINRESKYVGERMYSKSHFLMSILGDGKPVYFREDLDTLHFSDWFTFNTFCLQFAFVQTKKTSITAAMHANRRITIPVDEPDLPLNLRCVVCLHNNRGWNHASPCFTCQDRNPRERLDYCIKHLAIGTESSGLCERTNAEKLAIKQAERMQKLRKKAVEYMNWGFNRLDTLVLRMDGHTVLDHMISDAIHRGRGRGRRVEDSWQFIEDMKSLTKKGLEEVEFLPRKAFVERFGEWDPKSELA